MPFSAPMVLAALAGRKTKTRRIIKPRPSYLFGIGKYANYVWRGGMYALNMYPNNSDILAHAPYQLGDQVAGTEWHKVGAWRDDGRVAFDYRASPELVRTPWCQCPDEYLFDDLRFRLLAKLQAVGAKPNAEGFYTWEPGKSPFAWVPPMFMPYWASRLPLRITSVRVERVQDITTEEILAEGLTTTLREHDAVVDLRRQFAALWDSINGAGAFERNDWTWVFGIRIQA